MLTHNPRWSHAPGNQVVPSRWQATVDSLSTISIVAGPTAPMIDGLLEHSPAGHVRRPRVSSERRPWGYHLRRTHAHRCRVSGCTFNFALSRCSASRMDRHGAARRLRNRAAVAGETCIGTELRPRCLPGHRQLPGDVP